MQIQSFNKQYRVLLSHYCNQFLLESFERNKLIALPILHYIIIEDALLLRTSQLLISAILRSEKVE